MSILIKGMKMPKTCWECFAENSLNVYVVLFGGHCPFGERIVPLKEFDAKRGRHPSCPLIEVPASHGPLVDAGALYKQTAEWEAKALAQVNRPDKRGFAFWNTVLTERTGFKHDVMDAPVIIGAEEGSVDDDPSHPFADDVMMGGAEEGANNAPENG